MIVQKAGIDLSAAVAEVISKHDLTYGETLKLLAEQSQRWAMHLVRSERHPDDPDKKGDEA